MCYQSAQGEALCPGRLLSLRLQLSRTSTAGRTYTISAPSRNFGRFKDCHVAA